MRDVRHRFSDERHTLRYEPAALHHTLACHAADAHVAGVVFYVAERGNAIKVDEHRWRGEPEVHRRNEALSAREWLRVGAMLAEQGQRFVDRCRAKIFKRCWFHAFTVRLKADTTENNTVRLKADTT